MTKFVQIAVFSAEVGTHDCGIFALDEDGIVWSYQSREHGWVAFTNKRSTEKLDGPRVVYEAIKESI